MNLAEARSLSIIRRVRNALVKAERTGKSIVRGPCGTFDDCGARWSDWTYACGNLTEGQLWAGWTASRVQKLPKTNKCCVLCAVLLAQGCEHTTDIEAATCELLDLRLEDLHDLIAGFDYEERIDSPFYFAGRRLAREFVSLEEESLP